MQTHPYHEKPARLLVDFVGLLTKGKALDIAMGEGRNALYLASQGFEVEGLEKNEKAIASCLAAAESRGLKLIARTVDLEQYQLSRARYDLVTCFYYLQRSLIPQIREALKPGGMVVYETFLIDNHLQFGHPKHREYCFEHNELLNFFRDFRVLFYHEGLIEAQTAAAQIIAQKP
jgi:2-polyprenyl-3-methyl-5-hydroxy-6-metoxy-1,4-benzoquinol methylase